MRTTGTPVARAARYRAWRSASVMAVSPIGLRGMASTPNRYVTIHEAGEDASVTVLEAPTVVAGLNDVAMMRQAIQHGSGHLGVAEYLRPIGKSQIGGDQQRRVFVQLADQVEQQLAAWLAEWQIAQFIDGDQIIA